jgi:hypothetical protein
MPPNTHDAAQSAVGYLYQSQWPLLELIRRAGEQQPDLALTLELHDDVSWEQEGTATELLQVKHHIGRQGGLGDKSVDLWKTLDVWMDAHPPADPMGPVLTLVTTSVAAEGSVAAHLRPLPRSAAEARKLLDSAAKSSDNATTAATRQRYLQLEEADRDVFVGRIYVLDGAPQAGSSLEDAVRAALILALPLGHEDEFLEQLWGWWHREAIALLRKDRATVSCMDVRMKVQAIADGYKPDNLPTLVEREDVTIDLEQTYGDHVFVEQLRWIAHTATTLQKAMVDYYRAYVQRARWVDRDLIEMGELESFEENLADEWERAFDAMIVGLGETANEETKQQAGHALFQQVSNQTVVKVRERYAEQFFTRGQLHSFADVGRLGWHPEFEDRLKEMIEK